MLINIDLKRISSLHQQPKDKDISPAKGWLGINIYYMHSLLPSLAKKINFYMHLVHVYSVNK